MKSLLHITFYLLSIIVLSQDKYKSQNIIDYDSIISKLNANDTEIYEINKNVLDSIMKKTDRDYIYLYTFAWWCEPCIKKLPHVLNLKKDFDNLQLLIITTEQDDSKQLLLTKKYKNDKFNITFPIFNISDNYSKRRWKKYDSFIQEVVPNHKDYGLSLSIILNKEREVIYASTYNESIEEEFQKIKEIIKE
ncbi:MAG: hypothetical protein WCY25_00730 [Moheibacter sp.]